jgi:hypothetical protein
VNAGRLILFTLLVVAAWLALFGDKTPYDQNGADVVAPLPARSARGPGGNASRHGKAEKAALALEVAALIPREQLIPTATDGRGRGDLFPPFSWTPPPRPVPERSTNPPPPMAPPVPFVYLGKKSEAGQWEAYLGRGEQVFIVREGMTLDGIYKVKSLTPPTLTLIYLPLRQSQTIPIGASP